MSRDNRPLILAAPGPNRWQAAFMTPRPFDPGELRRRASAAFTIMPLDPEALRITLSNQVLCARQVLTRDGTWFGRLLNRISGVLPGYVELTGTHLLQTLDAAEMSTPEQIDRAALYLLRLDAAERALARLSMTPEG